MNYLKSNLIGIITLLLILTELIIGFSTLALVNIPRALIRTKKLKISLYKLSNWIGEITVLYLKLIMQLMHGKNSIQVFDDNNLSKDEWYLAISNHSSWADIFIILTATNYKIPLLKIFMKKELWWIPFVFLANTTLNMPFVHRHSREALKKNPELRYKDYESTIKSCKRFHRTPTTIFSYAEGTRHTSEKHIEQNSPYQNLLKPKVGGIATALSAVPQINKLLDFTIVYESSKKSSWSFLKGDMRNVKVDIQEYSIPDNLKNKNYLDDGSYRADFKQWIEALWVKKDARFEELKF
ncbi:acetyltransferase [Gammaproteobacteria bacterium]|nr:acetyltransferase [Gammaproteobacteria bacterium]|tara:strand:- start:1996 stop:2883 length:888 start_codon:yes stop_codon:yes gene_type:complete